MQFAQQDCKLLCILFAPRLTWMQRFWTEDLKRAGTNISETSILFNSLNVSYLLQTKCVWLTYRHCLEFYLLIYFLTNATNFLIVPGLELT